MTRTQFAVLMGVGGSKAKCLGISSVVDGHRCLFRNADSEKMFDIDPPKYQVAYDGWCTTAISMGKKLKSDPRLFRVHGDKTYLFSNADAKNGFRQYAESARGTSGVDAVSDRE